MQELMKKINEIMGSENIGSQLTIRFFGDGGIVFGIYEQEIPVVVDKENMAVYLDCETTSSHLTYDMLNELTQITKLIKDNLEIVVECVDAKI